MATQDKVFYSFKNGDVITRKVTFYASAKHWQGKYKMTSHYPFLLDGIRARNTTTNYFNFSDNAVAAMIDSGLYVSAIMRNIAN